MTRRIALLFASSAFLFVACTPDTPSPEQEPSTNINQPTHIVPPDEPQAPVDSTDVQQPADSTDVQQPADSTGTTDPVTPDPEDPAVDLGLSVKWASCNLGASKPEEFGDYYAWAEIEPYYESLDPLAWKAGKPDGYGAPSYRWYGEYPNVTKYCPVEQIYYWGKSGDPDGNTIIDADDDAATVKLGSLWRIPTEREWKELKDSCTWTWTTLEGVSGFEISASNGAGIFLPAAGMFDFHDLLDAGSYCAYWTADLNTNLPDNAILLHHYEGYGFTASTFRYHGCTIRPVRE